MDTNELTSREDILIGRVVDREASQTDWSDLESLAAGDPGVWARMACAQRDHDALCSAFQSVTAATDHIEVVDRVAHAAHATTVRIRSWSGWAVAAVVALTWAGLHGVFPGAPRDIQTGALGTISLSPDEALTQYLDKGQAAGRVLGELPKVMVETHPTSDEKVVEVLFVRQIYERAFVNALYEYAQDEHGQPAIVPVTTTRTSPGDSF